MVGNRHPPSLQTAYGDVENAVATMDQVFLGTAGSIVEATNQEGYRYYVHRFYDGARKRRDEYLAGPVGDSSADATAEDLRARIAETKALVTTLRMLAREGYAYVDTRTFATLAAIHNHGIFAAGGVLVGSHAYGVLLNRLGVRTAPYSTEDIDLARASALALPVKPDRSLLDVVRDSGIDFVPVPSLSRNAPLRASLEESPPTSYKQRGRAQFMVDLLVPARGAAFATVPVPELNAHATALPYLAYLLAETQHGALLAREGACQVRVPLPERFAVHKLLVSQLRTGRDAKSRKDLEQAATLLSVLPETFPGAINDAVEALPTSGRRRFRKSLGALAHLLENTPAALEELGFTP